MIDRAQDPGDRVEGVAALLLAGGASRRFGTAKAFLDWEGRPLIVSLLDRLRRCFAEVLLAVGDPAPFAHLGVPVLVDDPPGQGPLTGLAAGLEAMRAPRLFAVACDLPLLDPRLVRGLCGLAAADPAAAVIPRTAAGPHPLHALYHRRCREAVATMRAEGVWAVQALAERVPTRWVEEAELRRWAAPDRALFNLNRPEDLAAARRLARFSHQVP